MPDSSFFAEQTEQSRIKSEIVTKYFWAWAKVMIPRARNRGRNIAYVDLFSGPGVYDDGTESTPILILKRALQTPPMPKMLVTVFNDRDKGHVDALRKAVAAISGIESFWHPPQVWNVELGVQLTHRLRHLPKCPTLMFIDPWGYRGLTRDLIGSAIQHWGSECIFFFNYNRVNPGLSNPLVSNHMTAMFSEEHLGSLRPLLQALSPAEREAAIMRHLKSSLNSIGGDHMVSLRYALGERASHHLVFVGKHPTGKKIMSDIMAEYSSTGHQGVPTFVYNPSDEGQLLLFDSALDDLKLTMLQQMAGQTLTVAGVFSDIRTERGYRIADIREAIRQLEQASKVSLDPPASARKNYTDRKTGITKVTVGDTVLVSFPQRGDYVQDPH